MRKIFTAAVALFLTAAGIQASIYEKSSGVDYNTPINKIFLKHYQSKNIAEPKIASDAVFLRRVALTTAGRLPSATEVKLFLQDDSADKRSRIIEKFLQTPGYADMQAMRFADMLRIKSEFPINLWPNAVQFYHRTIHDDLLNDRSLKDMFYEMLTVSGSNFRTAYANFFRASADRSPEGLAKMVLLTTMNMRETEFTEDEFKRFARLFSCVKYKSTYEWKEEIVFNDFNPVKIDAMLPDGSSVTVNTGKTDPRKVFADWLFNGKHDYFERAIVNRAWHWFFGRGIHKTADALPRYPSAWDRFWGNTNKENVPFSEEIQNYLIAELKKSQYSLKHLYKVIMNSVAFNASSLDQSQELIDNFAAYPVRRLESELLIDALASVTLGYDRYMSVIPEPFTFLPSSSKAVNIADGSISTGNLDSFGRPPRDSGLYSERNTSSTDSQGLYLMNSTALYGRINNYCRRLQRNYRDDNSRLTRIYMDILSRTPSKQERATFKKYQSSLDRKSRNLAWSDTVWVLFNSKEFIFHH